MSFSTNELHRMLGSIDACKQALVAVLTKSYPLFFAADEYKTDSIAASLLPNGQGVEVRIVRDYEVARNRFLDAGCTQEEASANASVFTRSVRLHLRHDHPVVEIQQTDILWHYQLYARCGLRHVIHAAWELEDALIALRRL